MMRAGIAILLLLAAHQTTWAQEPVMQQDEGRIHKAVREFLTTDEWNPLPVEETNDFRTSYQGDNGTWTVYAAILEDREEFAFYSIMPDNVPEDRRAAVAEFITRANFGMYIGNFELDWSDGEVRFKTSIDVEGGDLTATMIKNLTYLNVLTMDRYYPGLHKVAFEGADPAAAVAEIEQ